LLLGSQASKYALAHVDLERASRRDVHGVLAQHDSVALTMRHFAIWIREPGTSEPAPCSKTPISAPRPDRRGAGCGRDVKGREHVRRPLAEAFDRSGTWLDVGCANGYLLETLPAWLIERGITVEPFGLELIPTVADLARSRLPRLAERIYTGDVTEWEPPRRWMFVTVLTDAVPPSGLRSLVRRLLDRFVEPGGRLIVSS
jgi:hypothetical protein